MMFRPRERKRKLERKKSQRKLDLDKQILKEQIVSELPSLPKFFSKRLPESFLLHFEQTPIHRSANKHLGYEC